MITYNVPALTRPLCPRPRQLYAVRGSAGLAGLSSSATSRPGARRQFSPSAAPHAPPVTNYDSSLRPRRGGGNSRAGKASGRGMGVAQQQQQQQQQLQSRKREQGWLDVDSGGTVPYFVPAFERRRAAAAAAAAAATASHTLISPPPPQPRQQSSQSQRRSVGVELQPLQPTLRPSRAVRVWSPISARAAMTTTTASSSSSRSDTASAVAPPLLQPTPPAASLTASREGGGGGGRGTMSAR
eukprot:COSAG05_NODE_1373_length_5052_cov_4.590955_2_plen_241_part_00